MKRIYAALLSLTLVLSGGSAFAQASDASVILDDSTAPLIVGDAAPAPAPSQAPDAAVPPAAPVEPGAGAADAPAFPTAGSALSQFLLLLFQALLIPLTMLMVWIGRRLIKWIEAKTNIDIPDAIESKIDQWVEEGIALAAEKSHQKIKEKTDKLKGPEKLETASKYVLKLVEDRGWDDWTRDKVVDKIESKLGVKRPSTES